MSEFAQRWSRLPARDVLGRRFETSAESRRVADRGLWVLGGILIVLTGLLPFFASYDRLLLVQQALYLGLLALSLNLLVNTTGLVSFGHAMFFGLGAYMVGVPFAKLGWDPLLTFGLTPVIGAVSAFVIGLVVLRGKELYFALLTLGVGQLVWATAHGWQSLTGGTNGTTGVFGPEYLSPFVHPNRLYWFIFGCVFVSTAILYVITRSAFGDALRGIRENRRRAEFVGLPVKRYELAAFVIAGTFGAVSGGLFVLGETQIGSSQIDWTRSSIALIVCLVGGIGFFLGPFAGAVFYIFVFDYIIEKTVLWDTVLGIVVLAVALAFSGGLVGAIHWLLVQGAALLRGSRPRAEAHQAVSAEELEEVHLPPLADLQQAAPARVEVSGPPLLAIEGATKRFGGLVAVDDVNLTVQRGSIHAIIGPNGAGKTTFFNLVTGLMQPDAGRIVLDGGDVTGMTPWRLVRRGVGRSFQQTNLFWTLSSLMNVVLAGSAARGEASRLVGGHSTDVQARASELLGLVGLRDFANAEARELSHGDQRSLEIATALAVESRLLLLDEPTAGLSPTETKAAVALIRKIAREQELTVLFVEHDMEVVFGIADWITVLHRGSVLADGTPAEIRANPEVQRAYLGEVEEEAAS